jgi:hypothetical protein
VLTSLITGVVLIRIALRAGLMSLTPLTELSGVAILVVTPGLNLDIGAMIPTGVAWQIDSTGRRFAKPI